MESKIKELLTPYYKHYFDKDFLNIFLSEANMWIVQGVFDSYEIAKTLESNWGIKIDLDLILGIESIKKEFQNK